MVWRLFFFFNDTATTEIYTLSLHDALPISKPNNQLHLEELQEIKEELFRVEIPLPPDPPLSGSKLSNNGKLFNPQYRHARYWGLLCLQYER
mgnify:CR=1 FL=1